MYCSESLLGGFDLAEAVLTRSGYTSKSDSAWTSKPQPKSLPTCFYLGIKAEEEAEKEPKKEEEDHLEQKSL